MNTPKIGDSVTAPAGVFHADRADTGTVVLVRGDLIRVDLGDGDLAWVPAETVGVVR